MSLTKNILGQIIMRPNLLDKNDVSINLFETERERRTFRACQKLYKKYRRIEEILLAEEIGGNDKISFITSLTNGAHRLNEDGFAVLLMRLRERKLQSKLLQEVYKQSDFILKGNPIDLTSTKKIFEEIEKLNNNKIINVESIEQLHIRKIAKRETLITPILGSKEIIILSGLPKVGKSLFTLNLAARLAQGRKWLGFEIPKAVSVLVLQTEMSTSIFKDRTTIMFKNEQEKNFLDRIYHSNERTLKLDTKQGLIEVSRLIESKKSKVVIIDPLVDFHNKKENDANEMASLFQGIRSLVNEHGTTFIIVHHFAKLTDGREGGYMARGSSVISTASDGNWQFQRLSRTRFKLSDEDYLQTVALSFESRNFCVLKPKILKLNNNLWFEDAEIESKIKIDPWDIVEVVRKAGGSIERPRLENKFDCSHGAFVKALKRAIEQGLLDSTEVPGARGKAQIVFLFENNAEPEKE